MILDQQTLFSDAQAVTADAESDNIIDLAPIAASIARDIGKGTPIPILIQVVEDFDKLTSLKVQLQVDSTSAFSSPTVVAETPAILLASLVRGYEYVLDYVPRGTDERYLRLYYDVTGTTPDNGAITAGIVMGRQTNG